MKIRDSDTIAAIATALGEGAIAVIRVSGVNALSIADKVFVGKQRLSVVGANTIHFGRIVSADGETVDEVLASVFRAPHSYTGETSVELSCHGGMFVTARVLETVLAAGARQADPGEFTKRSFLNGRIDLSQAEAVADLIHARSQRAHASSLRQLAGRLAERVTTLRSRLLHICSLVEIELDFAEEGIPVVSRESVRESIVGVQGEVRELLDSFQVGRHYRDGVLVVLAGKPNSGKSSIFNMLLKDNRAIVSPTPGTTRDYIEEAITLGGVLFRLVDTAGLRDGGEPVEIDGVGRSRDLIASADVVVYVIDSSLMAPSKELVEELQEFVFSARLVVVKNKIDLIHDCQASKGVFSIGTRAFPEVHLSAKTGDGIDLLSRSLIEGIGVDLDAADVGLSVTNRRHAAALERVLESLSAAVGSIDCGMTNEFIALDLHRAVDAFSEVTGEITTDDIINQIFSTFCIGK